MKKVLILLFFILIFTACSNETFKTEYSINEEANLDNIYIMLIKTEKVNDSLQLTFTIKNKRGETITIDPDNNFKYYSNDIVLSNTYKDNKNTIKNNKEQTYTLQYEYTDLSIYNIYFYSGIVENNIKFTFTDKDIK